MFICPSNLDENLFVHVNTAANISTADTLLRVKIEFCQTVLPYGLCKETLLFVNNA